MKLKRVVRARARLEKGMGATWPTAEQWTKLLAMSDDIKAFIKEHDAELKTKPE